MWMSNMRYGKYISISVGLHENITYLNKNLDIFKDWQDDNIKR